MSRAPLRTFTFEPLQMSAADMIEAAELSGVDPLNLAKAPGAAAIKYTAGLAWIYNRVDDPTLTFDDVLAGRVEVAKNGANPPERAS